MIRWIITAVVIIVVVGGLVLTKYLQVRAAIEQHSSFVMPPEAITSITAETVPWNETLSAIATLSAYQGVEISAEEAGRVEKISFEPGTRAKQGDVLVQLDVSVEQAQLVSTQERKSLAKINLDRSRTLLEEKVVSQAEYDQADSQFKQADAEVRSLEAQIKRKTIRAPFDGKLGVRKVNLGQYLTPGTPVVELQSLDPIYCDFSLPQQHLKSVSKDQLVEITVDAYNDEKFAGKVTTIEPAVDSVTRQIKIQAQVANPAEKLRPGMFARVAIATGKTSSVVVLPKTAVHYAPYGTSVFVIEKMKNQKDEEYLGVRQQFVKLGDNRGDQVAVEEGIKSGEQVASSGIFKLRPNAAVLINNAIVPSNLAEPAPPNR